MHQLGPLKCSTATPWNQALTEKQAMSVQQVQVEGPLWEEDDNEMMAELLVSNGLQAQQLTPRMAQQLAKQKAQLWVRVVARECGYQLLQHGKRASVRRLDA